MVDFTVISNKEEPEENNILGLLSSNIIFI